jgi:hypothetical protein
MGEIINQLKTIIGQIPEIKKVYYGIVKTIEQYPAVVIFVNNFNDEYLALGKIKRTYNVKIIIYQIVQDDLQSSQENIYSLADKVLEKLNDRNNLILNGKIDFSLLQSGETGLIQREGDVVILNINYKAIKTIDF